MKASELLEIKLELEAINQKIKLKLSETDKTINLNLVNLQTLIDEIDQSLVCQIGKVEQRNAIIDQNIKNLSILQRIHLYQENSRLLAADIPSLTGKLNSLTNFSFPMLELFPGIGQFTEYATAAEPLYLIDYSDQLTVKSASRFNSFYASRRLMRYTVSDFNLNQLPLGQIGVAFCFNMFFMRNIDFILGWATEVIKVLRPGGYFMFNFVPNNTIWGLQLTENSKFSAIDHNRLIDILCSLGFNFIGQEIQPKFKSYLLFQKPGELVPFKLTSIVAKVIDKNQPLV